MRTITRAAALLFAFVAACGNPEADQLRLELEACREELTTCSEMGSLHRFGVDKLNSELETLKAERAANDLALLDTLVEEGAPKQDSIGGIPAPRGMRWDEILQGTLGFLGERDPSRMSFPTYVREVALIDYCFRKDPKDGEDCSDALEDLANLAVDEKKMRDIGEWVLTSASLLAGITEARAREWLSDYWIASHEDMPTLRRIVEENPRYLFDSSKKLEGRFLRRWMDIGGGAYGDDLLVVYRFWMTRLASRLKMPEAPAWREEVRASIGRTTTLDKEWYLSRLDK